jgi:hypothetical protein
MPEDADTPRPTLRAVRRDGIAVWYMTCPRCGLQGTIDEDQFFGRVSIECPDDSCSFHETIDFSTR